MHAFLYIISSVDYVDALGDIAVKKITILNIPIFVNHYYVICLVGI